MKKVKTFSSVYLAGEYLYNDIQVTITEVTETGRLRGYFVINNEKTEFKAGQCELKRILDNGGKRPSVKKTGTATGTGVFEKQFRKLQAQLAAATVAFAEFQANNSIVTLEDARKADLLAKVNKHAADKRAKKQATRRTEDAMLSRITVLRRWAKKTKRIELFQQLTDKMLEITE